MPTSLLEIIDLGDGEVVLQRADDRREPLVTIRFSGESRLFIGDQSLEVAKAMITAGLEAVSSLSSQGEIEVEETDEAESAPRSRILH